MTKSRLLQAVARGSKTQDGKQRTRGFGHSRFKRAVRGAFPRAGHGHSAGGVADVSEGLGVAGDAGAVAVGDGDGVSKQRGWEASDLGSHVVGADERRVGRRRRRRYTRVPLAEKQVLQQSH